jgi:hypothetical protein
MATPTRLRRALGVVALGVAAAAGVWQIDRYLNDPAVPRPVDYLLFWAAAQIHLRGQNPYDPGLVFALQAGNRTSDERAVMMWHPPWVLALVLPLGAVSADAGQAAWQAVQLALVLGSADWLWRQAGGAPARRWVAWLLALTVPPTLFLLVGGQINGFVLAGLAGFAAAGRAGRPVLAGAAVALTAVKPHLLVPLAVGLLIDAARSGEGRRVVLGGVLVGATAAVVATVPNPAVWGQYLHRTAAPGSDIHYGLADWFNPLVGAWARRAVPGHPFWVQCVPTALAAVGFGAYWWACGRTRDWPAALPRVVVLGLLTAPYGGGRTTWCCCSSLSSRWRCGSTPAARLWPAGVAYAAAGAAAVAMTAARAAPEWYVWLLPVLAGCAWAAGRAVRPPPGGGG